jgi:hypothetical protein
VSGAHRLSWARGRSVGPAVFAACGAVLFLAFLAQSRTSVATSESGSQALQAWDMLHGNLLLHGWSLSDVSFYTTELPEYMLVELVHGLNVQTVHLAAALSYTLTLLLAALLAKGQARGREAAVRMLIAGGIMLAPSLGPATTLLLGNPDHLGTNVPLLIIYLVLDRLRPRWWVAVLVAVLLTWAQIADTLVLFEGALPLILACAIRIARRRGPIAGQWYEALLAAGAVLSAVVARLVLDLIHQAGGFHVHTPVAKFRSPSALYRGLPAQAANLLNTFGADFFGHPRPTAVLPGVIHLAGLALAVVALCIGLRRLWRDGDLIVQLLSIAIVLVLAAYLVSTQTNANEILGLLPMGAALAGRVLGGRPLRGRLIAALAVALACYLGVSIYNTTRPPAPNRSVGLAAWLQSHHLDYGLAGFWNASIETVASNEHVHVSPVRLYRHQVVTTPWETDASWYDRRRHYADFVIASPRRHCTGPCLAYPDVIRQYGPPSTTYRVNEDIIMVWHENLLDRLPVRFWCGQGWAWKVTAAPKPRPCG